MTIYMEQNKPICKWISCSDVMPEKHKCVLVFNEYGEIWTGCFDRYFNFFCDNTEVPNVTHWMPLPEPPTKESLLASEPRSRIEATGITIKGINDEA